MFFGQFEHLLDDKNRLAIPKRMKEEAGLTLFILQGFDGCLSVYKNETFEALVNKINELNFNHKDNRDYIRSQLATAYQLDVDKTGRIQIPTQLISKFNIGKEVVIIGVGDHFEIWNKKTYLEYDAQISKDFNDIAEKINHD